jgi:hypothetical protein
VTASMSRAVVAASPSTAAGTRDLSAAYTISPIPAAAATSRQIAHGSQLE